ncbi:SDR family oxidoreductase [Natrarchaeobaculum aegyptiacum]|uniref:Short-chain dehydrogenase n=1 Tax=Natrarchaeobaculum aegyptiacum TaxID=745377 RepID=A0A2Z2I088_9EURY|nr:SDR family oxidoreductase [Natrarchaeobaculum aegyptiacum]ARS89538.1 short-chain dehydrogenase [Natrarchaeobaculum aegyptiacum]
MTDALDETVCIVTGGGGGLGRAAARELADQGASVVVSDLGTSVHGEGEDEGPARETVDLIEAAGGDAMVHVGDVTDLGYTDQLVEDTLAEYGRIDGAVNFAGILRDSYLTNMSAEEWDAVIHVHLRGHFSLLRNLARHWRQRNEETEGGLERERSFLGVTSPSALGNVGQANYGAAKAGVLGLTRTAAMELAGSNVRVNALFPVAATRMTEGILEDDSLAPEKVAPVVAALMSEDASDITGRTISAVGDEIGVVPDPEIERTVTREGGWSTGEVIDALGDELGLGDD